MTEQAVRSLATSVLTASTIAGVNASFFSSDAVASTADQATTIGDHISNVVADIPGAIQQGVVNGAISGAVDTAINGGDLGQNLLVSMQGAIVSEIGESVANEIGLAAKNGDINKASRYIAHAALGAGMDLATGGDGVSGAVGAVVGEATAELYLAQYVDKKLRSDEVNKMTPAQFQAEVAYLKGLGANLSALSAGIAAAVLGKDPGAAAMTGKNAAQNNELITLTIAAVLVGLEIADKAITAYDAWELAQAISEGDGEKVVAKASEIGVSLATDAIPGNVVMIKLGKALHVLGLGTVGTKIVSKVGGKVVSTGDDLLNVANDIEKLVKKPNLWSTTSGKTALENALGHWEKHKAEFPELADARLYIEKVHSFISNTPTGTLVKTDIRGNTLMYHEASNTFLVISKDGAPRTMFRPADAINYWNRQ